MISPTSEQDLCVAIRDTDGPLAIRGGGTRPIGRTTAMDNLSVAGLSGITLYEPGALTIVAQAGTPVAEIEAALSAEGQRLPFEPMDHRALLGTQGVPTIGGVVALNASGPRRIQAGACRDSLIGVRFVDGSGTAIKNGGRVMKNVTGYDLVKLLAGSYGTLGVLSEVSFKVLPQPETLRVLRIEGLSDARGVEALSIALGSPFEVSGAAHMPNGPDGTPVTLIRIEGFAASVDYRAAEIAQLLSGFGETLVESDPEHAASIWRDLRDVSVFAGRTGDVWRVSVKPGDGPAVAAALPGAEVIYDWGGGLVWLLVPEGRDVRGAIPAGIRGHATLIRGSAQARRLFPVFHPEPAAVAALAEGLRKRFDPRGLLNPGMMA